MTELLAVDLGDRKTGLARMNTSVKIPEPLPLQAVQGEALAQAVAEVATNLGSERILVGWPANLHTGQTNEQTAKIEKFVDELSKLSNLPVELVDESLSTIDSQKWQQRYPDAPEDSLAACVILERYIEAKQD